MDEALMEQEISNYRGYNVLIMSFMGATCHSTRKDKYVIPGVKKSYVGYDESDEPYVKFTNECGIWELEYHSSWEWLMTVVEKIETPAYQGVFSIDTFKIGCYCSGNVDRNLSEFNYELTGQRFAGAKKFAAVYECAVKFIQWWNSGKSLLEEMKEPMQLTQQQSNQ